jgi:hypothetical protein
MTAKELDLLRHINRYIEKSVSNEKAIYALLNKQKIARGRFLEAVNDIGRTARGEQP